MGVASRPGGAADDCTAVRHGFGEMIHHLGLRQDVYGVHCTPLGFVGWELLGLDQNQSR